MYNSLWRSSKQKTPQVSKIKCLICSQFCDLKENETGKCSVYKNENNTHTCLIENTIASYNIDPVEKKPLYHFLPNSRTFSFGSMGCNFDCAWCQNSSLAHPKNEKEAKQGTKLGSGNFASENGADPLENKEPSSIIINTTKKYDCKSISFTYNEPTVFIDLMLKTAQKARAQNIHTVLVSNGYQSPQTLKALLPSISAANIDLKSFKDSTYKDYCGARLKPVLNNIKTIGKSNTWLELTTLIVPTINDSKEELQDIANFIANEVGVHVPWHISRFRPQRKLMSLPNTPMETLLLAYEIGKKAGLHHVYVGNATKTNTTTCPHCQKALVTRNGYYTEINEDFLSNIEKKLHVENSIASPCPYCENAIHGLW